jgi:hypothetical protein
MSLISLPQLLTFICLIIFSYSFYNKNNNILFLSFLSALSNPILIPLFLVVIIIINSLLYNKIIKIFNLFVALFSLSLLNFYFNNTLNPFFNTNGDYNLFLGNNPNSLSPWGYGDLNELISLYNLDYIPSYRDAVFVYLFEDPFSFFINYIKKIIIYILPFDNFKASSLNILNNLNFYIIFYISLVQISIYYLFFKISHSSKNLYLFIFLVGWFLYSIFTVKIRYRMPFDLLLWFFIIRFQYEFKK